MFDLKKIWSQRFHAWVWVVIPLLVFALLMQLATWSGLQPPPSPQVWLVRSMGFVIALAVAGVGLWRLGRVQSRLLRVVRDLASGRLESRAPTRLWGVSGELAVQINSLGKMLAHYRDHQDLMVMKTTSRLRVDQERLSELNQEMRRALRDSRDSARTQSELFSNLSHELRTPLAAILGYADLLRKSGLNGEQEAHLQIVNRSARGMLSMINDLLDWSRIEAGQLRLNEDDFDVFETVEDTCALLAPLAYEKRLELIPILYHDVPPNLRGDGSRLRQILTNLISNAIKFTEHGEIVVRVMREREDDERVWLRFSVTDTGIGIEPEHLARLFQPFQQVTHGAGGSGLGLSITRKLTELMSGKVKVQSTPGTSSTFSVILPFTPSDGAIVLPLPDSRLRDRLIWVFEPHTTSRLALMHWLEFWGARVQTFDNLQTLQATLQDVSAPARPAAVILGLPGEHANSSEHIAFYRYCADQGIALLVLVASASLDFRERVRSAGAMSCLPKSAGHVRLHVELVRLCGAEQELQKPLAGKRALVADNNPNNRRYLQTLCEELGLDVREASDGAQALQVWMELQPEFVLLDSRMPLMDGASCAREIRRRQRTGAHPRILAVSAHLEPEERADFLAAGADEILLKPFDEYQLLQGLVGDSAVRRTRGNSRLLHTDPDILHLLQQELPPQFAELEQALAQRQFQAARDAVHQLHGSAAFYHLIDLKECCATLENELAQPRAEPPDEMSLEAIRTALRDALADIQKRLAEGPKAAANTPPASA